MKNTSTTHSYKILSMVLAIAMIISMLPVTAFAEAEPDDNTYATSGVTVSGKEDDPAPATTGGLLLDDGGDERCTCTAFQSDADCPICRDDATQCFYYYCMCEALCDEDNINTECPICRDDYTSCVQAVEVPEIMPLTEESAFEITGPSNGWNYINNTIAIGLAGDYTIANKDPSTPTIDRIAVSGAISNPVNIILNGVNIDVSAISTVCAFGIGADGVEETIVNLTLSGTNTLISGDNIAGLQVPDGATLTIGGTGSLTVTGGYGGAGIGGNGGSGGNGGGTVIISGGTVEATSGGRGAGIGGGSGGNGGTVTISGGTVKATGGSGGAGIGGGSGGGNGGTVTISGGTVKATGGGGGSGAGIGGGYGNISGGNGGAVTISGGTVEATGGDVGGAGIGGCHGYSGGSNGTLEITGGSVKITGGASAADNIAQAKNGSGTNIYCAALTIGSVGDGKTVSNYTVNGSTDNYGLTGVKTDSGGKVYFYLPASTYTYAISLDADNTTYYNAAVEVKTDNTGAAVLTVGGAAAVASATISNVTVSGTVGTPLADNQTATITLANATFTGFLSGQSANTFMARPSGVHVNILDAVPAGSTTAIIKFSGNPTSAASFPMGINIPYDYLQGGTTDLVVTTNPDAKWDIKAATAPDTLITAAAIAGVTSPVATETPSTAITNGTGFTAALAWNGNPATFDYSTAYTANITLTAATGYTFSGGFANTADIAGFTVNGNAPTWVSNSGQTLLFSVTFPVTGTAAPLAAPDAPTNVSASASNAQATVSFTPAVTGGAAASYTVTSSPGSITATGSSSPITVTGLTNDTAYTFTVTATNTTGTSAPSAASNSVTPQATTYVVSLMNGTGGGNFAAGTTVIITADTPPSGQQFKEWIATGLVNSTYTANPLTFTMPSNTVSLTATYENIPATYSATVNPTSKTFAQADSGYGAQTAQTFTVTNTGTGEITGLSAAFGGSAFEISTALSATSVTAGNTVTVSVRPKTGNAVGTHTDTLTIAGNNGISLSVGLSFTVVKSAADKVADDTAALTFDSIKGGNTTADNITVNLTQPLPSIGANGCTITWSSDNTAVIANDGTVTRPEYSASDAPVTLTATITNGTASDTQTFTLTVKKKEQKQTTVEVKPNTPQADATGLDALFTPADDTFLQNNVGASIEYRLEIEQITAPAADVTLVEGQLAENTQVLYLDVSLWKEIAGAGASDGSTKLDNAANPITITITLPQSLWNKDPYTIIRVHDDGSGAKAETITPTYDNTLHTLTFTTNKFSTYAIAYTQTSPPNPPAPPTNPSSSSGGSSSSGKIDAASPPATQWVDTSDAKALAESAKEQAADSVRTRSSGEAGIRKKALQTLGKSGLTYRHDTVAHGAVQVRVYVDEPSKATKDILVSGYVAGARTEQINAKFGKWFTNKFKIISMDQQGDFGMKVRVAAKVDLSGMDTSNLYFYSYDKAANKYKLIVTEYRIDSKGYLHFSTVLAGDIIVSDGALTKKNKQQNADDGTYNYLAQAQLTEIMNDTNDGTGMNIQPEKAQPQDFAASDSIVEAVAADGVLKLESRTVPAAITGNVAGNVNNGGVLQINLDAPNVLDAAKESGKLNIGMIAGIAIALFFASMILWAVIPRKDDMLVQDDER